MLMGNMVSLSPDQKIALEYERGRDAILFKKVRKEFWLKLG